MAAVYMHGVNKLRVQVKYKYSSTGKKCHKNILIEKEHGRISLHSDTIKIW